MAELPILELTYQDGCPDCGYRKVSLPPPLPVVRDDFDWLVRDYDGFRQFMIEELAARFGERRRWTPADMEVVITETLAVVLDQLSDLLDRTTGEAFLATARRPQSVRRLLNMIGYPAVRLASMSSPEELERLWLNSPHLMNAARMAGPRAIHTQRRMVTTSDYAERLEDHPMVNRAMARSRWTGSWDVMNVAVRSVGDLMLEQTLNDLTIDPEALIDLKQQIQTFHEDNELRLADLSANPTLRVILLAYLDAFRMAGTEVCLVDAEAVGINMALSVRVAANYFQSEIRDSILQALGNGPGGFFEPGRLAFGEDLHASDIFETVMALDGVNAVCLNRFKRVGRGLANQADAGFIRLDGLEFAVCDRNPAAPHRGYLRLTFNGGRKG